MLKKLALMSAVSAFALGSAYAQTTTPPAPAATPDMTKSDTMKTGSTGAGTATFVPSQKPDQFLASKFSGTDVVGSDDQKVGDVSDILFDKDGKIEAYVIAVGGFLGMGAKDVALAPSAFQVIPGDPNSATNSSPKLKITMTKGTDGPLGEGQPTPKVRKLEREGPLGREVAARGLIDTLRTSDAGDTQSRAVKVASGGGATAHPRSSGQSPQELKTQEGTRVTRGPKRPAGHCGPRFGARP